jgi:hypothetical protein
LELRKAIVPTLAIIGTKEVLFYERQSRKLRKKQKMNISHHAKHQIQDKTLTLRTIQRYSVRQ